MKSLTSQLVPELGLAVSDRSPHSLRLHVRGLVLLWRGTLSVLSIHSAASHLPFLTAQVFSWDSMITHNSQQGIQSTYTNTAEMQWVLF